MHHHHRGPAAGGSEHGPRGVRASRRPEEIHVGEGVDELPLLQ